MKEMEFDTTVDMALFREFFAVQEDLFKKRKPRKYTFKERIFLLFIYFGFAAALSFYGGTFTWPAFIIMLAFFIFIHFEILHRAMRISDTIELDEDGLALGKHHYFISEKGIDASGSEYNMHINWSQVSDTYESKNAYIIQLDQLFAFIIRKKDIEAPADLKKIVEQYRTK